MLNEDIAQLTSFMERDRIEVNGNTIYATYSDDLRFLDMRVRDDVV